jgi:hypothetical protein
VLRPKDVLFGELAVALKMLTRTQLDECIQLQRKARRHKRLGLVCEERGYLSRTQVRQVLAEQSRLVEHRARGGLR